MRNRSKPVTTSNRRPSLRAALVLAIAVALVGGLLPFVPRYVSNTTVWNDALGLHSAGANGLCADGFDYREYRTNGNNDADEQDLASLTPSYQDLTPLEETHEWVLALCVNWEGNWNVAPGGDPVQQVRGSSLQAEADLFAAALSSGFGEPEVRTVPDIQGPTEGGRPFYVGLETWIEVHEDTWQAKSSSSSSEGVTVTTTKTPEAVVWRFGALAGECDNRGAIPPAVLGSTVEAAPCGFTPEKYAEETELSVQIRFRISAESDLSGTTQTTTELSDAWVQSRRVDEVQAFGVDPSGTVSVPPPADRDYDDGRDCGLNPLSWGQCARDAVEWAVDIVAAGIELLTDLIVGCGEAVADKVGEIVGIATQAGKFLIDPVGWIEEKVQTLRDTLDEVMADLGGAALDLVKGALEWDLLVSDPVKWIGKVGCGLLIEVLSGSIATKFTKWLDDLITKKRNDRNNDNDPNNDVPEDVDPDTTHPSCRINNSFPTGTQVLMANGSHKPINLIAPGDMVRAFNTDTGLWSDRLVLDQWSHLDTDEMATLTLVDGGQVSATDHHQFWVNSRGEWVDAEDLVPGDLLLTPEGVTAVDNVDLWDTNGTLVWELTVDIDHTFTVQAGNNDVVVHNCGPFPTDKNTRRTRDLTESELNHAFDRHASEVLGVQSARRTADWDRFVAAVDRARSSELTFSNKRGGSDTIAHLARVPIDGQLTWVVVDFFEATGEIATVVRPSSAQLTRYLDLASRSGP